MTPCYRSAMAEATCSGVQHRRHAELDGTECIERFGTELIGDENRRRCRGRNRPGSELDLITGERGRGIDETFIVLVRRHTEPDRTADVEIEASELIVDRDVRDLGAGVPQPVTLEMIEGWIHRRRRLRRQVLGARYEQELRLDEVRVDGAELIDDDLIERAGEALVLVDLVHREMIRIARSRRI